MTLKLAPGLVLPDDFATEGAAVIGMRGSGKSNSEARWCEVLHAAGVPFVVIDPKGDWGGIRSSADGKTPGLPIPVFGGLTGDFPLEEHLGSRIADLLIDQNLSAVLDVSRLSLGKRGTFLTAFCEQLLDRHQREPHVRCVILEEAHRYVPQTIPPELRRAKEAVSAILLEGRAFGLGCWAATQRPARLHKDVLEEVGTVIVHRIGAAATNDLKTVRKWVEHEELGPEIGPSLTKLAAGEAWVLAPAFGIVKRVQVDRRRTFDSASTPLVGKGSRPVLTMADIDTGAITEALSDAIERAKADDPNALHRRVRELQAEVAQLRAEIPAGEPEVRVEYAIPPEVIEVLGQLGAEVATLAGNVDLGHALIDALEDWHGTVRAHQGFVNAAVARANVTVETYASEKAVPPATAAAPGRPPAPPVAAPRPPADGELTKPATVLLEALAGRHPIPLTTRQWSVAADRSTTSSGWDPAVRELRRNGMVDKDTTTGDWYATEAGLAYAGVDPGTPPPSGAELVQWWCARITGPGAGAAQTALRVLAEHAPITQDQLADIAGWSRTSSGPGGAVGTLVKLGLAERRDGLIHVNDDLR